MYIGTVIPSLGNSHVLFLFLRIETQWILNENNMIVNVEMNYYAGLYKLFDEILVNATDNSLRFVLVLNISSQI